MLIKDKSRISRRGVRRNTQSAGAVNVAQELLGACQETLEALGKMPSTRETRSISARLRYAISKARGEAA